MTNRDHQETDSDTEFQAFNFPFEKIYACYVVPCVHSACILYIMAAATMRVPTSIYSIAIMTFVVCDLLAWAGTTLGLLLCAPSFFETLLQRGMTKKLYVWKGISMAFEILILLMLVLVEVIKKERVIDCICVCVAVFLFSGVLGTIFIKHFYTTLEKIKLKMEETTKRRALHEVPSVSVSGYQGNISQNDTDFTQPSVPEFIDFDGSPSNPTAPFAPPSSRTRPIVDRHSKSKVPYKNEKLLNDATKSPHYLTPTVPSENKRRFSPTGNEVPPDHLLVPPADPFPNVITGSPPNADAPLYAQNHRDRRVPSDSRLPFDENDRSIPSNFSIESDFSQQHLNNSTGNSTDPHYFSSGVSDQVPPPMLTFSPPETKFRAPFDHANDFNIESSYNNHRM